MRRYFLSTILVLLFPSIVFAHALNDSYFQIKIENQSLSGQLELPLNEVGKALGVTFSTGSKDEVRSHQSAIENYIRSHLTVTVDHAEAQPQFSSVEAKGQMSSQSIDVYFTFPDLKKTPSLLEVDYRLFFEVDPQHRGLFYLKNNKDSLSAVLSAEEPHRRFPLDFFSFAREFGEYVKLGTHHIATGIDHILFLIALLLQSVVFRAEGKWQRVPQFRTAFWNMLTIATIFTAAHSIR